jgi:hypothetical protein
MIRNAMMSLTAALGLAASSHAQQTYFDPVTGRWVAYSQTRVDNIDPFGRVNTSGTTLHSSATDPYRESSKHNGTMRQVNRPKFDAYGNIVGYEVGVEWTNSVTGETHGDTKVVTNNGLSIAPQYPNYPPSFPLNGGGLNEQTVIRSGRMGGGVNVQGNVYGGRTGGFGGQHTQFDTHGGRHTQHNIVIGGGGQHAQHEIRSAPGGGQHTQFNAYGGRPSTPKPAMNGPSLPRTSGYQAPMGGMRTGFSGPRR